MIEKIFVQSRPPPSIGHLHLPAGIAALAMRAATKGSSSAAAHALSANYGLASSFGELTESAAEGIAIGNPWLGGVLLAVIPTSTSANDTTQGCGGPCDAPGASNQAKSPDINPADHVGKTPSEIDQLAKRAGLIPKGKDPINGKGAYIDPVAGKQRVLIHPGDGHSHVNNPAEERLDANGNVVDNDAPEAHLPLGQP